eukprot:jgi/Tetstr1/439817/TSEL_028228.t1
MPSPTPAHSFGAGAYIDNAHAPSEPRDSHRLLLNLFNPLAFPVISLRRGTGTTQPSQKLVPEEKPVVPRKDSGRELCETVDELN